MLVVPPPFMTESHQTYAYLWIEGFECDPSDISELMQLDPDDTWRKGDLIQPIDAG